MTPPIYLDYAATTPLSKRVAERMCQALTTPMELGNPSSNTHLYGFKAQELVHLARESVAKLINAKPRDITFTSGATESNNIAIMGITEGLIDEGTHIVTTSIEHKAVLSTCQALERKGVAVTYIKPDVNGNISVDDVERAITPQTSLVSIMHVNNELGSVNDIESIGNVVKKHSEKILFHVDAAQSVGKLAIDVKAMPYIDLMTFSAHKFYGPKGIGGLYANRKARRQLSPVTFGGDQEGGLRPGTLATHQIIGMGEAASESAELMESDYIHTSHLRDLLLKELEDADINFSLNGQAKTVYPGILNLRVKGIEPDMLVISWPVAISTGSACNAQNQQGSYVIAETQGEARYDEADSRLSFGRYTKEHEIKDAVKLLKDTIVNLSKHTE
jgi:cysteine desulfurase